MPTAATMAMDTRDGGDVFEDFDSDQELLSSEEEAEETANDDELARVLDLMSDGPVRRPVVPVNEPDVSLNVDVDDATARSTGDSTSRIDVDLFDRLLHLDGPEQHAEIAITRETDASSSGLGSPASDAQSPAHPAHDQHADRERVHGDGHEAPEAVPRDVPSVLWGKFSPDKMPQRKVSAQRLWSTSGLPSTVAPEAAKSSTVRAPRVACLAGKERHRPSQRRVWNPQEAELTFRPKINQRYFRRGGGLRVNMRRTRFAKRMDQDLKRRRERERQWCREKTLKDTAECQDPRPSLIGKGSLLILERNGLLHESRSARLERLVGRSKYRKRQDDMPSPHRKIVAEATVNRTFEALYQRGLEKMRTSRNSTQMRKNGGRVKTTKRTHTIIRDRLDREMRMLCSPLGAKEATASLPQWVTFVEFSCVLLYFGLVPNENATWHKDPKLTMLWHAWCVFAEGQGDSRRMKTTTLKNVVERVIMHNLSTTSELHHHRDMSELLEIFRLNYMSRGRAQGLLPKIDSRNDGKSRTDQSLRKRHHNPSTYSLHGKKAVGEDLLTARERLTKKRIADLRREKETRELSECTFKPRISSPCAKESDYVVIRGHSSECENTQPSIFDRLYDDASVRQTKIVERSSRARIDEQEAIKKEQQISPSYVNGMTIDERLHRLQISLSNNAIPIDYHRKITQMRAALTAKVEEANEKARRLDPYSSTDLDDHAVRSRSLSRESTRRTAPINGGICNNTTMTDSPSCHSFNNGPFKVSESVDPAIADVCIDVHISPVETSQLYLDVSGDPWMLTERFADQHNLGLQQRHQLHEFVSAKLEELLDL